MGGAKGGGGHVEGGFDDTEHLGLEHAFLLQMEDTALLVDNAPRMGVSLPESTSVSCSSSDQYISSWISWKAKLSLLYCLFCLIYSSSSTVNKFSDILSLPPLA